MKRILSLMRITESKLRRLIKEALLQEAAEFQDLKSPLEYFRHPYVRRLSLVDPDSPEFKKGDVYFAQTQKYDFYGPSGRKLKKPKVSPVPGAEPGTLAWLDYHWTSQDGEHLYIDFIKTRQDMRGMGYARQLVEELIKRHPQAEYIDFGKMMNPGIGKIYNDVKAKYADKINFNGYHDY